MAKPRPRTQEDFIIARNSSSLRFGLEIFLTLFFWIYTFLVIFYFATSLFAIDNDLSQFLHAIFNTTNQDAVFLLTIGLILFFVFYFSLQTNRIYNKKRFGNRRRRKYPTAVTLEELSKLGLMEQDEILKLQQQDYIVFEKNPIISLQKEKQL